VPASAIGIEETAMNGFGHSERSCWSWATSFFKRIGIGSRLRVVPRVLEGVSLAGLLLLASCSTPSGAPPLQGPRFRGAADADFIVKYYSDQVSHLLKPQTMEGPFYTACERSTVLDLAGKQPRHGLAVILLIRYFSTTEENRVKLSWVEDLKRLGYHDVVFLLAGRGMDVDGRPILPGPHAPTTVARQ
jgi:hypothetical protein